MLTKNRKKDKFKNKSLTDNILLIHINYKPLDNLIRFRLKKRSPKSDKK